MKLHRQEGKPDWELDSPETWNTAQKLAAKTNGLVTPGNGATATGLSLVGWGIWDVSQGRYWMGAIKIVGGRAFDVFDGWLANKTRTKSPIGEAFDAAVDKIEIFAGLTVLAANGVVPPVPAIAIAGQNGANMLITMQAKRTGAEVHPTKDGKRATTAQWAAISAYTVAHAMGGEGSPEVLTAFADATTAVGTLVLGIAATNEMYEQASTNVQQPEATS